LKAAWLYQIFHFVDGLYVFLSDSTYRSQQLKNRCTLTLKGLPGTRWCERADAAKALVEGWKSIQEVLHEQAADKEQKADTRKQAEGFSRRMDELETAVMATAWNDITGRLNSTIISLQDPYSQPEYGNWLDGITGRHGSVCMGQI